MSWFKNKSRNRRLWRRQDVLEVKVRSKVVRAARTRAAAISFGVLFGAVLGLYVVWKLGQWTLDQLAYENKSFALQRVDVQTDGVISREQLQRWSGVKPGQNLLALDLARVKYNLELEPMIRSASVERILPGTLRVRVLERAPIAQVNLLRTRNGGGVEQVIFQLDADGFVVVPLDPRQRAVPLGQMSDLPVIAGIHVNELQPGRRVEVSQVQAALKFVTDFERSPMAGLVDLKRIDILSQQVLIVTTGQGSEVTFAAENFDRQLARWRKVYDECLRESKAIATLDLAVNDYTPLTLMDVAPTPPSVPKNSKPPRRKKNV
jgi:cell division septal protein FtsQ